MCPIATHDLEAAGADLGAVEVARRARLDVEAREPVEEADRSRDGALGRALRVVHEPSRTIVGCGEERVHGEREPREALDATRRLDRQVKPDAPPEREGARSARPQADAQKEFGRDGQRREGVGRPWFTQPDDETPRNAGGHGLRAVEREPGRQNTAASPIGVEQLRPARCEVDHRDLELREAHRPEGPDARRAPIARRERQEQRVAGQRPPVVMELQAIAEQHVGVRERAREQRLARPEARDHHRRQNRLGDDETRVCRLWQDERLGEDRPVEDVSEVAAPEVAPGPESRLEQQEAQHHARGTKGLGAPGLVAPAAKGLDHSAAPGAASPTDDRGRLRSVTTSGSLPFRRTRTSANRRRVSASSGT